VRQRAWNCLAPTAIAIALLLPASPARLGAQVDPPYQTDFPPDEFKARLARIYDHIGADAVAVVQGVGMTTGFMFPRQNNEFYYLCGVETPGAYLMLDGRTRTAVLYLPGRDARLEAAEGRVLSADDAELVRRLTGVDRMQPIDAMRKNWPPPPASSAPAKRGGRLVIYTPFAPAENYAVSRGEAVSAARHRWPTTGTSVRQKR
jgi:Xaa-Pro aminopeptidase